MAERKSSDATRSRSSTRKPARSKPAISLEELKREIDERAHQIYLDRLAGHREGDALSDWLRAEVEIRKKYRL